MSTIEDPASPSNAETGSDVSRRDFVAFSVALGLGGAGAAGDADAGDDTTITVSSAASAASAASAPAHAAPALQVVVQEVTIKTPDGTCDAAFFHPATGKHPGVLVWTDAFGLRASMRDIGRRLASEGYSVLVPNPFYRVAKAPIYESAAKVDFKDPATMAKLKPLMGSVGAPGAAEKDATAYIAFLDAQPQVDKSKKIGTHGYCMGGALMLRTAAAVPERVNAGASFHGGALVTDQPDSPHLLAPKIKAAAIYFAIAKSDDDRQPEAKDTLKHAFGAVKVPTAMVVYPEKHGWCVPDMPSENGVPIYNQADAEKAWKALGELYHFALA